MIEVHSGNFLGIVILGAALLWAVRLVYGRRRGPADDLVKRCLLLAGWIFLLAGMVGVASLGGPLMPLPLLGLIFACLAYFKYVAGERRALLWALAVAADKGIPLEKAARAFADERSVQIGIRISRLADLLESGVPLSTAATLSRNTLPSDALLASRIGDQTGQMGPALQMSLRFSDDFELIMRSVLAKYFYLVGIFTAGTWVMTFVMLKIVPVWTRMFWEFGLDLPQATRWIVSAGEHSYAFLPLFHIALLLLLLLGVSYYVRWSRYELPFLHRFWRRCDSALIMQALALSIRQQREFRAALAMIAAQFPFPSTARRLEAAVEEIDKGVHWCDALQAVRLLKPVEVAVLKSAERVGNLAWALEEMADSALRRFSFRLRATLTIAFPIALLTCGFFVLVFVVGLFMPLIAIIQGLS
jgi:type II secretory pathway component PulF